MARPRGLHAGENGTHAFPDAGFDKQQIPEVVPDGAVKTIFNDTNFIAQTPLDERGRRTRRQGAKAA